MQVQHFTAEDYMRLMLTSQVYDIAIKTPLDSMQKISSRYQNNLFIKREDRQTVNSFKIRGAYSMLMHLNDAERTQGVVAASAGNHAQGVALGATHLGIKALIVMPKKTPTIKIDAVKGFGGNILLYGDNLSEAMQKALEISRLENKVFIPPYDHPFIIAGQGTVGLECIQQCPSMDKIFVPVGGGGLISGIAVILKQLNSKIQIIAVESEDSACLHAALKANTPVPLKYVGLFADGLAVRQIGDEPFRLCTQFIDDIVTVNDTEICTAVKDIFDDIRAIAEPSGAVALAGAKKYITQHKITGENIVTVLSGANTNFHKLRYISEMCIQGEHHEALLSVVIPEHKGSFLEFCQHLQPYTVTEFSYRSKQNTITAHVFINVQIQDKTQKDELISILRDFMYEVHDISDDAIAKTHLRYMLGGNNIDTKRHEELYQITFPEEKGAIIKFLTTIAAQWNISLFHYRNQGIDYDDILVAFQLNALQERDILDAKLRTLGYRFKNVSQSLAYQDFLC